MENSKFEERNIETSKRSLCKFYAQNPKNRWQFQLREFKIKILFLSVAYPELNPLETFWSEMKLVIAGKDMTYIPSAVEEMIRTSVQSLTPDESLKYVKDLKLEKVKYKDVNSLPTHYSEEPKPKWLFYT